MTIRKRGVGAVTVGELLDPLQHSLRIPHYQRPYSWEPATAMRLLDDIHDVRADPLRSDTPYVLGAVILHENGDRLDVVDGQQRLLTLRMILAILDGHDLLGSSEDGPNAVSRVWASLQRRLSGLPDDDGLVSFIRDRCQLVRIVTDDVDEAFRVFDSQNYRGKPLAPHDLLKAHHLREMRDDSAAMKAAVVQTWEDVGDDELDRLFSIYLYRIARWSRGESAPGFSSHDIEMFKGISKASPALSPANRYHLAAQAALPLMTAWGDSGVDERDLARSRFQIDAPQAAGKPFFEMVAFMLDEIKQIARQGFPEELEPFCHYDLPVLEEAGKLSERASRSRYRYVSELYLAALLYYSNSVGEVDFEEARTHLFSWAYAPRIEMQRVQYRTIDNRGRGDGAAGASVFGLLRNATTGRVINRLPTAGKPHADGHEADLARAMGRYAQ